ncbi:hypothetical protein BC829DRAFT_367678 [Chytridium lagenaria]|nr:hypothetical protein BC829DRAFT_367678 [Chytridium lagenaria]
MRSYLVERRPPIQRRWWWSKWWRSLSTNSISGRGGGGLGGWGTPWGGSTTGLSIGGALRLGPGAQVGSLAALTGRTLGGGAGLGNPGRIGVLGTGGVDDPRMVTAMVVVAAVWMVLGILVSTAVMVNDGIVASYFVSSRRGGRRRNRGQRGATGQGVRRRRSRGHGGASSPSAAPQRRTFLRSIGRGLGFGRRRTGAASGPASPQSVPGGSGGRERGTSSTAASPGMPLGTSSPGLAVESVTQMSPLSLGTARDGNLSPSGSTAPASNLGREYEFDPLPEPALVHDDAALFVHTFRNRYDDEYVSTDHDDEDSVIIPLEIPGGGEEQDLGNTGDDEFDEELAFRRLAVASMTMKSLVTMMMTMKKMIVLLNRTATLMSTCRHVLPLLLYLNPKMRTTLRRMCLMLTVYLDLGLFLAMSQIIISMRTLTNAIICSLKISHPLPLPTPRPSVVVVAPLFQILPYPLSSVDHGPSHLHLVTLRLLLRHNNKAPGDG